MHSQPQNPADIRRRPQSMSCGMWTWGIVLLAAGCGGSGPAPPKIAPVTGMVRYNGVPVRDAYVKFSQEGCPVIAGGFTDDRGRFELTSYESGDGAPVGDNKVTITVAAPPDTDESADAEAVADPAERKNKTAEVAISRKKALAEGGGAQTAQPRSRIPKKYASEETSKLSFVVKPGVENQCDFDLTD